MRKLHHTVTAGSGPNVQKPKECAAAAGLFCRTVGSLTAQEIEGSHEQLSENTGDTQHQKNQELNSIMCVSSFIVNRCRYL